MNEIEVKFSVKSFKDVREKIEKTGFIKEKEFIESVSYYDAPDGKWKNNNVTIRTKTVNGKTIFTVKKKIGGEFKSSVEKECSVDASINDFREMLLVLELVPDIEYTKTREHYSRNDDCAAELDYIGETGDYFIELETQSEEKMKLLINELGFENLTPDLRSYPNIIREYQENKQKPLS